MPAKTLLQLVREEGFERLDAVKLDVEGAEDLILEPYLREAEPALLPRFLLIEAAEGHWQVDLPALLGARGYRPVARTRMNLAFERS